MTIDMTFETREKLFTKEAYEDGKKNAYMEMYREGFIPADVAANHMGVPVEELLTVKS